MHTSVADADARAAWQQLYVINVAMDPHICYGRFIFPVLLGSLLLAARPADTWVLLVGSTCHSLNQCLTRTEAPDRCCHMPHA